MPIKHWVPPVTERKPDTLVLQTGTEIDIIPWAGSGEYEGKTGFILVYESDGTGNHGIIIQDDEWEEFDDLIREYRGLRKLRRRETTSEPRVQPVESTPSGSIVTEQRVITDMPDLVAEMHAKSQSPPPAGPLAINMSEHALKQHLKKPGSTFNVNGVVWERRGDGMLWHIGGERPPTIGESLDNEDALKHYAGKSITVTEG